LVEREVVGTASKRAERLRAVRVSMMETYVREAKSVNSEISEPREKGEEERTANLVSGVDVERLVHRERNFVTVERRVGRRVVRFDDVTFQSRDELFEPAFALGGSDGRLGAVVTLRGRRD
jgi:hypothetical protein